MIFSNILAEMARRQISKQDMANKLGMSISTFNRKVKNQIGFTVNEVTGMQEIFNDASCTFDYLFEELHQ